MSIDLKSNWPNGMPQDFRYEPQSSARGNGAGQQQNTPGAFCGASSAEYGQGLGLWQQWYDAKNVEVPLLTPGSDMRVSTLLTADHGGQAWMQIACGNEISDSVNWTVLERAASDRGSRFLPSNPGVYAWRVGTGGGSLEATFHVPSSFSCPTPMVVGRWVWKTGNSCNDYNNIGRKTETLVRSEVAAVGSNHDACTGNPETFISCIDFRLGGPTSPTPAPAPTPAPPPTTAPPAPTPQLGCAACKNLCQDYCNTNHGGVTTSQCWGTPVYNRCTCKNGQSYSFAGCPCENSQCPANPPAPAPAPTEAPTPTPPAPTPPAPTPPAPTPTVAPTQAPTQAPTPTLSCPECHTTCLDYCNSIGAQADAQCWGSPRYSYCKCSGQYVFLPGCPCEQSSCPATPPSPAPTPTEAPTPTPPAPTPPAPTPTAAPTQAPTQAPTPTLSCPECHSTCTAHCNSIGAHPDAQCWGSPRYSFCKCSGQYVFLPGCPCERDNCPTASASLAESSQHNFGVQTLAVAGMLHSAAARQLVARPLAAL